MCHATQDVFKRSPPVKSSSSLEGDAAAAAAASSRRSSARAPPNEAAVLAAAVGTYVSLSLFVLFLLGRILWYGSRRVGASFYRQLAHDWMDSDGKLQC